MQENNQSNTIADEIVPTLTNTMPIGDTSMAFFPFVRGEFTNLLLQGQIGATTLSTSRMLDFDEDTGYTETEWVRCIKGRKFGTIT